MSGSGAPWLLAAAACNALAALAHAACLIVGAPAFRLLGAGEEMARWAEQGRLYPYAVACAVGAALGLCSLYALAGAGVGADGFKLLRGLPALPGLRGVLAVITAVYLLRAVAFPLLKPAFPDNSDAFWLVSSGICLAIGVLHGVGVYLRWEHL